MFFYYLNVCFLNYRDGSRFYLVVSAILLVLFLSEIDDVQILVKRL